jgi:hypothetical protein
LADCSCWCIGWDVHCLGLTATKRREAHWEKEANRWEIAPTNSTSGWNVAGDNLAWKGLDAKLVNTLYTMSRGWPDCSWPRVDEGVEVLVEVHSSVEGLVGERTTCRCFHIHTDLS